MIRSICAFQGRSATFRPVIMGSFGGNAFTPLNGNNQQLPSSSTSAPTTFPVRRRQMHHLATGAASITATTSQIMNPSSTLGSPFLGKSRSEQHRQQHRTVFIQTENTPNPESIKFVPTNLMVLDSPDGNGYYLQKTDATEDILKSPLASSLFKIDGVKAVYFGAEFVTVTKYAESKWQLIRPEIFSTLMDFFEQPDYQVLMDQPVITDTTILDDDDEIVAMIKELIEDRIRPAVQEDGGDIRYKDFEEDTGIVTVQLAGSCVGCPSSSVTLKNGVENMLMHYIPEVTAVVSLEEEEQDGGDRTAAAEVEPEEKKQKSYEERLKQAGIPFSD
mmetsp:Transcript_37634/g.91473  ORF Transcript_37634/g.91473 Transcript_37634/m.91473 type:complete len:332 (+) Transcript_37634:140-1135(+)|eukprot:CAMPEP_0113473098 /NCGR_PEP_ID=MMETSP0014_2-20120614/17864_1 /TAXON_ID=2857 /ORGANISM="Nitzschia sp." /LENGTH=331 /DNA_ID=CAMNT_0000365845 /DNA_START=51 /DNA_END=1046 /DNA_ORIENTATION=+ /assembly_acc=CAM_ASM_000159